MAKAQAESLPSLPIQVLTPSLIQQGIKALHQVDPKLSLWMKKIGKCGLNPKDWSLEPGASREQEYFHAMGRSILFQQLSGKAATTIMGRLLDKFPGKKFSAQALKKLSDPEIQSAGVSRQKLGYLRALQDCALSGAVKFGRLHELSDEKVIAELTQIKGIGTWTAQMFLLFRLGRADVLAEKDLGIQKGLQRAHGLRAHPSPALVLKRAKAWAPHRSVASWYLWRVTELK